MNWLTLVLTLFWQNGDNDPQHLIQEPDYTHCNVTKGTAYCSTIDHFAASERLYQAVKEAGVIHSGENQSNHSAIYMKVGLGDLNLSLEQPANQSKVSWEKATDEAKENFRQTLAVKLGRIHVPEWSNCHAEDLEEYTMSVLEAMKNASQQSLPRVGGESSKVWHGISAR